MSTVSESADETVKLTLESIEVIAKITGSAAKNVAKALYAISQNPKPTKGKITLERMLRTGEDIKIFSVKKDQMQTFASEAKSYGVSYTAIRNKKNQEYDNMIDIMVMSKDAPKVNRIVERFGLSTVEKADIKTDIDRIFEKEDKVEAEQAENNAIQEEQVSEAMIDDLLAPMQKEQLPSNEEAEKNRQLENSLMSKKVSKEDLVKPKKSVRQELKEIALEQQIKSENKQKVQELTEKTLQPPKIKIDERKE